MGIVLGFGIAALKFLVVFVVMIACANWARALGGIVYFALTFPMRVPRLRRFYTILTSGIIQLSFLFKFIGIVVSSSGLLLPFLLLGIFYPDLLRDRALLWGAFIGIMGISLDIMHRVHTMELPAFREYFPTVQRFLKFDLSKITPFDMMRLARAQFLDMNLVDLLILIVCYGLSLFCIDALWPSALQPSMTPLQEIGNAFSFLRVAVGSSPSALSPARIIINGYYGISLVIFTAFFISLTSRMIDEVPPTEDEQIAAALKAALEKIETEKSAATDELSG